MITVREINSIEALAEYRLVWKALFAETRQPTFFQTYEWFEVFWKHYGDDRKMRVLIVCWDEKPIGILPLIIFSEETKLGTTRVLSWPLSEWGTFYGPIGADATVTLRAGMKHIRETPRDWDLLDLRSIDETVDHRRTELGMESAGFRPHRQLWGQTALVDFEGTWGQYWASRSKKWRRNFRKNKESLESQGELTFVRYRPTGAALGDGDPGWEIFEDCMSVARNGWQGESTTGTTICHESVEPFLRDTHEVAARLGMLDLNVLYLDGKPIAFVYNYCNNGWVFGLRTGYDPQYSKLGPGTVLFGMIIKNCFARGDQIYDLGVGLLDYKKHWATRIITSSRYTHFASRSVQAQVLRMKRWYQQRHYHGLYLGGDKCLLGETTKE